jgi:hypothetical protein
MFIVVESNEGIKIFQLDKNKYCLIYCICLNITFDFLQIKILPEIFTEHYFRLRSVHILGAIIEYLILSTARRLKKVSKNDKKIDSFLSSLRTIQSIFITSEWRASYFRFNLTFQNWSAIHIQDESGLHSCKYGIVTSSPSTHLPSFYPFPTLFPSIFIVTHNCWSSISLNHSKCGL